MTLEATKINKNAFNSIIDLITLSPWLRSKSEALMDLWNLCNTKEQQDLLNDLFKRFTFITSDRLEQISNDIVKYFSENDLTPKNTYIIATADQSELDGSSAGLQYLKNKFPSSQGWTTRNFYTSMQQGFECIQNKSNIILFDDFIGTGKKLTNKIQYSRKLLEEKSFKENKFIVITFAAMKFGIDNIKNETGVEVFTPTPLSKGITDFESDEIAKHKKSLMIEMESKLKSKFKRLKLRDHSLGYRESESLFQIDGYNCPNNVFPIFWWPQLDDETYRDTIFKRAAE